MANDKLVNPTSKLTEKSSKSTILTGILSGVGLYFGFPPEFTVLTASTLVTLLPDSWFN